MDGVGQIPPKLLTNDSLESGKIPWIRALMGPGRVQTGGMTNF